MATTEKRLNTRYALDIDATIITSSASIPARVLDISAGGLRIRSPEAVLPETEIVLSLEIEEDTLLSGSVQWTIEIGKKDGTPAFEVGIEANAFIFKDQKAIGHTDRETMLREILTRVGDKQI